MLKDYFDAVYAGTDIYSNGFIICSYDLKETILLHWNAAKIYI